MRDERKEKKRDWKMKGIKVKGFIGLNSILLKPTEWLKYTNDKFLFPEINKRKETQIITSNQNKLHKRR